MTMPKMLNTAKILSLEDIRPRTGTEARLIAAHKRVQATNESLRVRIEKESERLKR